MDLLRKIDDKLMMRAAEVTTDLLSFDELSFGATEPPEEWVEELGQEEADRRFRRVKAGQMGASQAPMGAKAAVSIATSGMTSRANAGKGLTLNVEQVHLTVATEGAYQYPSVTIDQSLNDN